MNLYFNNTMGKISKIEYFRLPPRWLFVKITDDVNCVGWGERPHTIAIFPASTILTID